MENIDPNTRADIIDTYQLTNKSQSSIAKQFKCSQSTISRTLDKWKRERTTNNLPKPGRPKILTETQNNILYETVRTNKRLSINNIRLLFNKKIHKNTPLTTFYRAFKLQRWRGRIQKINIPLTKKQMFEYKKFCIKHKNDNKKLWIFTDETTMNIRQTRIKEWCQPGEQPPKKIIHNLHANVHCFGAIWWGGSFFLPYTGHLNQHKYLGLLQRKIYKYIHKWGKHIFLQDRATFHWTKKIRDTFEQWGIELLKNPAKACHINAIEYLWKDIKQYIREQDPTNLAELQKALEVALSKVTVKQIRKYILHADHEMKKRAATPIVQWRKTL